MCWSKHACASIIFLQQGVSQARSAARSRMSEGRPGNLWDWHVEDEQARLGWLPIEARGQ